MEKFRNIKSDELSEEELEYVTAGMSQQEVNNEMLMDSDELSEEQLDYIRAGMPYSIEEEESVRRVTGR